MSWNDYYRNKSIENNGIDLLNRLKAVGKTQLGEVIDETQLSNLYSNVKVLLGYIDQDTNIIDLGCGTGILSEYILNKYTFQKLLLVDSNELSIKICEKIFSQQENLEFHNVNHEEALHLVDKNTVLFAYEVIQHLDFDKVRYFTNELFKRKVKKIIYGGVPNLRCRELFYRNRRYKPVLKSGGDDVIGYWHRKDSFDNLQHENYKLRFSDQCSLYTADYRFDVTYTRDI
jgi:phospholipid N-methyltransferase